LSVDGIFGSNTQLKLKSAQRSAGVTADGVYGPNTRNAMRWGTDKGNCVRFSSLTW
jgi:peptidoglycan hydrolase-like protein with peptidoglycan-binding domain